MFLDDGAPPIDAYDAEPRQQTGAPKPQSHPRPVCSYMLIGAVGTNICTCGLANEGMRTRIDYRRKPLI